MAIDFTALNNACVLYYSMDNVDISGSTILDLTPNNYDITNNGGTTGAVGILNEGVNLGTTADTKYLKLDGQTFDFVRTTGEFYISLWWKPNNYLQSYYNFLLTSGSSGSTSHIGWELIYDQRSSQSSPQRLAFKILKGDSGNPALKLSSEGAITSNDSHHIFIAGDGTTAQMYVNNVFLTSDTFSTSTGTSTYPDFYVGGVPTLLNGGQGQFDELVIGESIPAGTTMSELAEYYYNSGAPTVNQQYPMYENVVYEIKGQVTLSGTATQGATLRLYDQTGGTYEGSTTTDVSGNYLFENLIDGNEYHVSVEYDDGTTKYNDESKPYVTPVQQ